MQLFLSNAADQYRISTFSKLARQQKHELGQFLTPAPIARLMARQFHPLSGHIHLLDAGAGVGALTAAFVERLLTEPNRIQSCFLTAYEIDSGFLPSLHQCLFECCTALKSQGIQTEYWVHERSFIEASVEANLQLHSQTNSQFTHAILNPPYKKIHSQSNEKKLLTKVGINTVNLYSAFVWLATLHLAEQGELVAITPRSFCNGAYYRPFRKYFLGRMQLQRIHIFESRSATFSEDRVLQENIIFHATKAVAQPDQVTITSNFETGLDQPSELMQVPYNKVVEANDPEDFIHIVTNSLEYSLRIQMEQLSSTLNDLGLAVSTGPVVDFRLRSALKTELDNHSVPLIYPESIAARTVLFPPEHPRKSIAIEFNPETAKWLIPSGYYVVIKRFSAKEEKRRVVAAICPPFQAPALGIENHLNYIHAQGKGINPDLARGLAAFLNSTFFDRYFRQFSGHTQVNATDLRRIRYPSRDELVHLGQQIGDFQITQKQLDQLVHENLLIIPEVVQVVQSIQRIEEAQAILNKLTVSKEAQSEQSALCLLALADIQPHQPWAQATTPIRDVPEMMDWLSQYYGKHYTTSRYTTIEQQTLHQFVQMGIVTQSLNLIDRATSTSGTRYQLQQQTLNLLKAYRQQP